MKKKNYSSITKVYNAENFNRNTFIDSICDAMKRHPQNREFYSILQDIAGVPPVLCHFLTIYSKNGAYRGDRLGGYV